jgi:fengycin family lipopeptide synthetase D
MPVMIDVITKLRKLNIGISLIDERLKLKAPEGVLTAELLEEIKKNKEDIIQYIKGVKDKNVFLSIPGAERKEYYPLSLSQRGLYFLHELDRDSLTHNIPHVMELEGEVDAGRLERSFRELIRRHEGLRTCFRMIGGEAVQQVREEVDFRIGHMDGSLSAGELMKQFVRPFHLETGPLVRVGLASRDRLRHWLLLDMHHLITDGVSQGILVKEFMALYNGEELPEASLQYRDYAEWQQGEGQQRLLDRQRMFWLGEFGDLPVSSELPLDHARPAMRSQRGLTVEVEMGASELSGLKELSEREGATLFMGLLAVYTILLGRLSNQEDVVVGTSTVGRPHADLEQTIGIFINTLCLRNYPRGAMSFRAYLREIRARTLACFEHQSYPYESLVKALRVDRRTDRNLLFDAAFTYANFGQPVISIPGLQLREHRYDKGLSEYDLLLWAMEEGEGCRLELSYSTELFDEGTIGRIKGYFRQIVREVLQDADGPLSAIRMLPEAEEEELCVKFNDTARAVRGGTVLDLIADQVRRRPGSVAVSHQREQAPRILLQGQAPHILLQEQAPYTHQRGQDPYTHQREQEREYETLTYGELGRRSDRLADRLRRVGASGRIVGVLQDSSIETMIAIVGIWKASGTYMPIDPQWPAERIGAIWEESRPAVCLTSGRYRESILSPLLAGMGESGGEVWLQETQWDQEAEDCPAIENTGSGPRADTRAYVIYTSGSTGRPKGVVIPHRGLLNLVEVQLPALGITAGERVLQFASLGFDASVWEIASAFCGGAELVIYERRGVFSTEELYGILREREIGLATLPPSVLRLLRSEGLPKLKTLVSAGEACDGEMVSRWKEGRTFINAYGPAEYTVCTTMQVVRGPVGGGSVSIGRPIANTTVWVLGQHGELQPVGVSGELCVSGAGIAEGYLNNGKLTEERFVANPYLGGEKMYRTGDLVRWLGDGSLEFLGRIDQQVKLRGYRIEPGEIESRLNEEERIRESVVMVRGSSGEEYLVAYYASAQPADKSGLIARLSAVMPSYMVPSQYVWLESLPLTINGKIDRRALMELPLERQEGYRAAASETEKKLVEIWAEVLKTGRENISVTANFFESGGHSISIIRLNQKINEYFNCNISVVDMFRFPTLQSMEEFITHGRDGNNTIEEDIHDAYEEATHHLKLMEDMLNQ